MPDGMQSKVLNKHGGLSVCKELWSEFQLRWLTAWYGRTYARDLPFDRAQREIERRGRERSVQGNTLTCVNVTAAM